MANYTAKSAVLFLIFNRPDTTHQVFAQIKKAAPSRLYIAADGPRDDHDLTLCKEARSVIHHIDWDCSVKTLFRSENAGCKVSVSSAIDWFFQQEPEGIILEDDCLPADDFFYFCDNMLERYRNDTRIHGVTGTNQQKGQQWGDASYYFSQCMNIWGWATWQRVWAKYDSSLKGYDEVGVERQLQKIFSDRFLLAEWISVFKALKAGEIDTWDYQLHLISFFENGLCVTPNVNLISNIGFRADATHTKVFKEHCANLATGTLGSITHPLFFLPEKEADYFLLKNEFHLEEKWRKYNKRTKRFKRWVKEKYRSLWT
jgi:hypothetical protein